MQIEKKYRRTWSWTQLQEDKSDQVLKIVHGDYKDFWPLTVRQIYYKLVKKGIIENTRSQYQMISKLLKWMRIDDRLPMRAVEDRHRTITNKRGYSDPETFIENELDFFLEQYNRCLIQGQAKHIEVWIEKDALLRVAHRVVYPFCLRVIVCKGYSSFTFIADFCKRAEQAFMNDQQPVILYFGDLDPSGVQMFEATIQTIEDEMGIEGIEYKRIGLNPEHIDQYNLVHDPDAIKLSESRYRDYARRFGRVAVELDALDPAELQLMITQAIEIEIDMADYQLQKEIETQDQIKLDQVREAVLGKVKADVLEAASDYGLI